jgi:hypothetical protein
MTRRLASIVWPVLIDSQSCPTAALIDGGYWPIIDI